MNLLLTLNLGGGYTHPNVRESHIAAAARWGAQYVELLAPVGDRPASDPFGCKLQLYRYPYPPNCRVCYIDGDAIVRADCPSPFTLVPRADIGAVANNQGEAYEGSATDNARRSWDALSPVLGRVMEFKPERYWNGGVMVFTPAIHLDVWRLVDLTYKSLVGDRPVGPMDEQTGINIAAATLGVPVTYLPPTFNRMGPLAWGCKGAMPDYVLHLANIGSMRGDKGAVLGGVEWREAGVLEAATA